MEKKSKSKIAFWGIILCLVIALIGGGVAGGIYIVNNKHREQAIKEYEELMREARKCLTNEEYDEALEILDQAKEIDVDDYGEVYKNKGRVYIRLAAEEYIQAGRYMHAEEFDDAIVCCETALDYLEEAEKYWKGEKYRFSDNTFYSCSSINDAMYEVETREREVEKYKGYEKLAVSVLLTAKEYLSEKDYISMNGLDTSDESDNIYTYYIENGDRSAVIMAETDDGIIVDFGDYTGDGVGVHPTATGFYYYIGQYEDGVPSGDGMAYISDSTGNYKVEEGHWSHGLPDGDMTYTVYNGEYVTVYTGEVDQGSFNGDVNLERNVEGSNKKVYATFSYTDYSFDILDDETIEEYGVVSNVYSRYVCPVFDKKGNYMEMYRESDIDTMILFY